MLDNVKTVVLKGKLRQTEDTVKAALEAGHSPEEILDTMSAAMEEIGTRFQANEVFVPEMMVSAKTMQKGVAILKPLLTGNSAGKLGKFIIGTVSGDLHDIGKNLVALMVESAGFEVLDLGADVPAERFVEAIQANPDCKVVGLSSLLTTTMSAMRSTVKAIEDAGLRSRVKIMVGGAPITKEFADEIGADAFTLDAGGAAEVAKALIA